MKLESCDLKAGAVPFGHRPALIVVDMSYGFTSSDSPLGGAFDMQITRMAELIALFHLRGWPVAFSTVVYHDDDAASVFRQHLPDLNILRAGSHWVDIDGRLNKTPGDILVEKAVPSAFFGTNLDALLRSKKADCLVIGGLTTSGCVRATAVDALQYNWPAWVIPDICGDRNPSAHEANLHDMAAKYVEVKSMVQALDQLNTLSSDT